MSKFNSKQIAEATREYSYEGGLNYVKSPVSEWLNFLFSSYIEDRFYETSDKQLARYIELTEQVAQECGWEFVARASFFARNELGMRSIAQVTAAMLNSVQFENKRMYFSNFFHRPDDVAEVFSIIENMGNGKRSHALVRGAGDYLSTLNIHSLGKYKMNGKQYNMYDLINLTHVTSPAINAYKHDALPKADTWEVAISTAAPEEKDAEWKRLVEEHKLGYLALIRNLRNILNCGNINFEWITDWLCPQIENEAAILKSLVFPYQIYQAYRNAPGVSVVQNSLEKAFRIACQNVPSLEGNTAILLDVSGSMEHPISAKSNITIKEVGAVFAAMLYIKNPNLTFVKFGTHAQTYRYNPLVNIFSIIDHMCENDGLGYGTEIGGAFQQLKKRYDRLFIVSDMQVMDTWGGGIVSFDSYTKKYNRDCKCYSFDLGNYHTQVANPKNPNVHLLTSLSEKIFNLIHLLESSDTSIVEYINTNYKYC